MKPKKSNQNWWGKFAQGIDEVELLQPDFITVLKIFWHTTKSFFKERPGQILFSAFILIMLWGYHGELELLGLLWKDWHKPGTGFATRPDIIPGLPWDYELISFWVGAILLVVIPILLIKFVYKEPLSKYGLGFPPAGRRKLAIWTFFTLVLLSLPAFWLGTTDPGMREVYPFYKPFTGWGQFALYQLTYLPFFIAIEFIFRGYLLFGLAGIKDEQVTQAGGGAKGNFYFHKYALLIQMLSYTAWHLGKPVPELWGTLIWGLAAGATAYASRSIWPVVLAHWVLNIFLDAMIWQSL